MSEINTNNTKTIGYGYSKWVLILDGHVIAPETGLYVFAIRNDNHISYELHTLEKGKNIWEKFSELYPGGYPNKSKVSAYEEGEWFIPLAFHYIPYYEEGSKYWKSVNNIQKEEDDYKANYWRDDDWEVLAFTYDSKIYYRLESFLYANNENPFKDKGYHEYYCDEIELNNGKVLAFHHVLKFHMLHWDNIDD